MEKALPPIPAKRYFTIGEVSELCGVKPYVLRYWEQEFTQLKPMKRRGNRRYYQHHEVLLVRRIRELLYDQGFTISGARNRLAEHGGARAGRAATGAGAEGAQRGAAGDHARRSGDAIGADSADGAAGVAGVGEAGGGVAWARDTEVEVATTGDAGVGVAGAGPGADRVGGSAVRAAIADVIAAPSRPSAEHRAGSAAHLELLRAELMAIRELLST